MKAGWQSRPFGDCIEKVTYTTKIPRKDFLDAGAFPVVSQEDAFINGYWDGVDDVYQVESPVVVFGDHTKVLKYIDFDFVLGADGVKLLPPKDFLVPKFFYYQLQAAKLDSLGYARHYKLLKQLEIKYPDRTEQHRVVAVLDEAFAGIATAKANAEKNLENARALFESHLDAVFSQRGEGWVEKRLGDVCRIKTGKKDVNQGNPDGEYPFFTCAAAHTYSDSYSFDTEALLVAGNGNVGQTSYYCGKFEAYQRTYVLFDFNGVSAKYLFRVLDKRLSAKVSKQKLGNTMPYIKIGMLSEFVLPVPPAKTQDRRPSRPAPIAGSPPPGEAATGRQAAASTPSRSRDPRTCAIRLAGRVRGQVEVQNPEDRKYLELALLAPVLERNHKNVGRPMSDLRKPSASHALTHLRFLSTTTEQPPRLRHSGRTVIADRLLVSPNDTRM